MKPKTYILLSCLLVAFLPLAASHAGAPESAAVKAAEAWLAVVDSGDYEKSWADSASLFRAAVTKRQWQQTLTAARKPLGDSVSRRVKTTHFATSLPGAPDGEYVVIQFTTRFANKRTAVETVTPMKDTDGIWRVSGYYVK